MTALSLPVCFSYYKIIHMLSKQNNAFLTLKDVHVPEPENVLPYMAELNLQIELRLLIN